MKDELTCILCTHFRQNKCYEQPPKVMPLKINPNGYITVYPEVYSEDKACGRFQEIYKVEEVFFK